MNAIVRYFLLFGCCFATLAFADDALMINWDQAQQRYQADCASCHGVDGNAPTTIFPKLAGQHKSYLHKQLVDYQQQKRVDPIMSPIAQKLAPADIDNILAYLISFKANNGGVDPALRERGEKLYRAGDLENQIPACAACHGPAGAGLSDARYPALAGQNVGYIVQQLQLFQTAKRANDPNHIMQDIAKKLSAQDMQAVASFINGLRPG